MVEHLKKMKWEIQDKEALIWMSLSLPLAHVPGLSFLQGLFPTSWVSTTFKFLPAWWSCFPGGPFPPLTFTHFLLCYFFRDNSTPTTSIQPGSLSSPPTHNPHPPTSSLPAFSCLTNFFHQRNVLLAFLQKPFWAFIYSSNKYLPKAYRLLGTKYCTRHWWSYKGRIENLITRNQLGDEIKTSAHSFNKHCLLDFRLLVTYSCNQNIK